LREHPGAACAVIDVVRATTTLVVLGERQVFHVLVTADIPAARDLAARHSGMLLAGEAGGLAPAGFDFGNAPAELLHANLAGRQFAFATTNGTRALLAAHANGASAIYAAALRNAGAIADLALRQAGDFILVCAGRHDRMALDDLYTAGVIANVAQAHAEAIGMRIALSEGAQIAQHIARTSGPPLEVLVRSDAGRAVQQVGLAEDLAACATVDASAIIPRVTAVGPDGELIITFA
jgi:2-phosphosulfolactate phosphatase